MLARRRNRRSPLLTYVVDPFSPTARSWAPAVRELALRAVDVVPFEVVCTGDRGRDGQDSLRAAAGIIALLATERVHPVTVVEDVMRAFADTGADISDPSTIGDIAAARQLDADAVKWLAASDDALELAREDRELARGLGDPPTAAVLYSADSRLHQLPPPMASGRDLVAAFVSLTS